LIFLFVVFAKAHELVAPCDNDDESELHQAVHGSMQIFKMFVDSSGELLKLPDDALTSSDEYSDNHGAIYSRIGAAKVDKKAHGWCAKDSQPSHILVDLTTSLMVTGVATQGRGDSSSQWVEKYSIETSENGVEWINHGIFVGNFDSETICYSRIEHPVVARFVKLSVKEYYGHPCLRWDVLTYNEF